MLSGLYRFLKADWYKDCSGVGEEVMYRKQLSRLRLAPERTLLSVAFECRLDYLYSELRIITGWLIINNKCCNF